MMAKLADAYDPLLALEKDYDRRSQGDSQFVRSLMSGLTSLGGNLQSVGAVASHLVGAENTARSFEREADKYSAAAQGYRGSNVPRLSEAHTFGDYGTIAVDMLSSNLPLLGVNLLGGLGGGLAAKALGYVDATAKGAKAIAGAEFLGAAIPYGTTTVGETYDRIRKDPEVTASPIVQSAAALGSGALQAWIGTRVLQGAAEKFRVGNSIPQIAIGQAVEEGLTETLEQGIQRRTHHAFNPAVNMTNAEAREEYATAMLGGLLVGGVYGGVGAAWSRKFKKDKDTVLDEVDSSDTVDDSPLPKAPSSMLQDYENFRNEAELRHTVDMFSPVGDEPLLTSPFARVHPATKVELGSYNDEFVAPSDFVQSTYNESAVPLIDNGSIAPSLDDESAVPLTDDGSIAPSLDNEGTIQPTDNGDVVAGDSLLSRRATGEAVSIDSDKVIRAQEAVDRSKAKVDYIVSPPVDLDVDDSQTRLEKFRRDRQERLDLPTKMALAKNELASARLNLVIALGEELEAQPDHLPNRQMRLERMRSEIRKLDDKSPEWEAAVRVHNAFEVGEAEAEAEEANPTVQELLDLYGSAEDANVRNAALDKLRDYREMLWGLAQYDVNGTGVDETEDHDIDQYNDPFNEFGARGVEYLDDPVSKMPFVVAGNTITDELLSGLNEVDSSNHYDRLSQYDRVVLEYEMGARAKSGEHRSLEGLLRERATEIYSGFGEEERTLLDQIIGEAKEEYASDKLKAQQRVESAKSESELLEATKAERRVKSVAGRFLERFETVRKTPRWIEPSKSEFLDISDEDLLGQDGRSPILEFESVADKSDLEFDVKVVRSHIDAVGNIAEVETPVRVLAPELTRTMMRRLKGLGINIDALPTKVALSIAAQTGISSLLSSGRVIALEDIDPNTVFWNPPKGSHLSPLKWRDMQTVHSNEARILREIKGILEEFEIGPQRDAKGAVKSLNLFLNEQNQLIERQSESQEALKQQLAKVVEDREIAVEDFNAKSKGINPKVMHAILGAESQKIVDLDKSIRELEYKIHKLDDFDPADITNDRADDVNYIVPRDSTTSTVKSGRGRTKLVVSPYYSRVYNTVDDAVAAVIRGEAPASALVGVYARPNKNKVSVLAPGLGEEEDLSRVDTIYAIKGEERVFDETSISGSRERRNEQLVELESAGRWRRLTPEEFRGVLERNVVKQRGDILKREMIRIRGEEASKRRQAENFAKFSNKKKEEAAKAVVKDRIESDFARAQEDLDANIAVTAEYEIRDLPMALHEALSKSVARFDEAVKAKKKFELDEEAEAKTKSQMEDAAYRERVEIAKSEVIARRTKEAKAERKAKLNKGEAKIAAELEYKAAVEARKNSEEVERLIIAREELPTDEVEFIDYIPKSESEISAEAESIADAWEVEERGEIDVAVAKFVVGSTYEEHIKAIEAKVEDLKSDLRNEVISPVDPIVDSVDPVDPVDSVDPTVDPVDPVDSVDLVNPVDPTALYIPPFKSEYTTVFSDSEHDFRASISPKEAWKVGYTKEAYLRFGELDKWQVDNLFSTFAESPSAVSKSFAYVGHEANVGRGLRVKKTLTAEQLEALKQRDLFC